MTASARRFYVAAMLIGIVYVFVTPLFTVPDEIAHFWRATAIARGNVAPAPRPAPVTFQVDDSVRLFAWHMQTRLAATRRYESGTVEEAARIRYAGSNGPATVTPLYTPLPYIPQAIVAAAGLAAHARPLVIFYAGRVANLAVWMAVVAIAVGVASRIAPIVAAVALLPMTVFQFASWSADAASIALAVLFTALAVRAATAEDLLSRREIGALAAVALLLTLCKPAYALLPALVLAVPRRRFASLRHRFAVIGALLIVTFIGSVVSMVYFNRAYYNMRADLPVHPAAQRECIRHAPLRFAGVIGRDIAANGRFYLEQMIGRFGANEIKLPMPVVLFGWLMLAAVAATTSAGVSGAFRATAFAIAAATVVGIVVSQYMIWSVVCGDTVDGVQGRYFLPVLPLLSVAIGGVFERRLPITAIFVAALLMNAAAIATQLIWYA